MKLFLILIYSMISFQICGQIQVETISNQFNGSGGLNLAPDGTLIIADFGESLDNSNGTKIFKLDFRNGEQPQVFATGLFGASGNDFDSNGNLFQSNIGAGKVSKISPEGVVSDFASNGLSCNVGVNIDSNDNVYVCNCCLTFKNTIRKISPEGVSTLFASSGLLSCPNGITRDNNNNMYVSNFGNGNVVKINPNGVVSLLKVIPGGSNGHLIYSKKENVLYVASHGSHKIYKLTLDGELTVIAGSGIRGNYDGLAMEASFSRPNGLALSPSEDTLFVNSSIPTSDFGGRPLNPSIIRMITGLRDLSSTSKVNEALEYKIFYDSNNRSLKIENINANSIEVKLITFSGRVIINQQKKVWAGSVNVRIDNYINPSLYIVQIVDNNGTNYFEKIFIK